MAFKCLAKQEEISERTKLIESINQVKAELKQNEALFNLSLSSDMIDFAIHKDIALKAQYNYLLKKYKECT